MTGPNARSTTAPWRGSSNTKAYTGGNPWTTFATRHRPVSGVPRASAVLGAYRRELHPGSALFFADVPVPLAQISLRGRPVCGAPASPAWPGLGDDQPAAQCAEALCRLLPGAAVGTRESRQAQSLCPACAPLAQSPPEQVQRLFAQIAHPMDHALFLVILRCGLRVSGGQPQAGADRLGATGRAGRARQGAKIDGCTCRLMPWPVSNSAWSSIRASRRRAMCFGIANASSSPVGESHPKEDGALCQGGGHHGELS